MQLIKLLKSNRGDTIVEVMIAIVIVSAVLGGAYASTNRNLKSVRQAQEHAEALKIAQGQVESLRAAPTAGSNGIFSKAQIFCIDSAITPQNASNTPLIITSLNSGGSITSPSAACTVTNGIAYHVGIDRISRSNGVYSFTVYVRWDSVTGAGQDQVTLSYNLGG